jgi:hypothetical protein
MHTGEVDERGGCDQGIMFTRANRHPLEDECDGDSGSACGEWKQGMAVAPMEVVPLAQGGEIVRVDGAARIEKPVDYIDGPRAAGKEERDPWFEANAGCTRYGVSPYDCHRGCIKTGKMPQIQNARERPARLSTGYGLGLRD